ncbi:MAG: hypothetical protein WCT77_10905 [Bacteroidota bacterium]
MRKIIFSTFLFLVLLIVSCSDYREDRDRFMTTYKEILIVREMFTDTAKANAEVKKIFNKNNYTEKVFFEEWKEYTGNPQEFIIMMDTIRERAQKEIIKSRQQQNKSENIDSRFRMKDSVSKE